MAPATPPPPPRLIVTPELVHQVTAYTGIDFGTVANVLHATAALTRDHSLPHAA